MLKKCFSLVLVLIIAVTAVPLVGITTTAFAENIAATATIEKSGDTITITVTLPPVTAMLSCLVSVEFDPAVVTIPEQDEGYAAIQSDGSPFFEGSTIGGFQFGTDNIVKHAFLSTRGVTKVTATAFAKFVFTIKDMTVENTNFKVVLEQFEDANAIIGTGFGFTVLDETVDIFEPVVNWEDVLTYKVNNDFTGIIITNCNETASGSLVIPEIIQDLSVTGIDPQAFYKCASLTNVTIPNGVTSIGYAAFSGCTSLIGVTIPNCVTGIGERVFYNCSSLVSIVLPDSIKSIEYYTFYKCTNLTSIVIPDSITEIKSNAFNGCTSLASAIIGKSVTSIGSNAFFGCSSLTSLVIPDNVISIGYRAFENCILLSNIKLPSAATSIDAYAFCNCPSMKSITVPLCIDSINEQAFGYYYDTSNHLLAMNDFSIDCYEYTAGHRYAIDNKFSYNCHTLENVAIKNYPDKLIYIAGDTLDSDGMTLTSFYSDGAVGTLTNGFTCSPIKLENVGTQTITVNCGGKTTTFDVTVLPLTVNSIWINTYPAKRSYNVGDELNTDGLTIKAYYNNGTYKNISSGFTCSPTKLTAVGTQQITVLYNNKTTTFNVTVAAVNLSGISVKSNPAKTEYYVGDTLNATGLTLTASYENNTTQTVTSGFSCSPTTLTTAGTQTITVTYDGKTTTFNVNVTAVALSGIAVKTMPGKTSYYVGDTFDISGLTLTAIYNNSTTQTVSSGFACSPTTLTTAGTQIITVTYNGKTTTFNVSVTVVALNSIAVKTAPTKISYYVGDTLDTSGLTLTATYNSGLIQTVASGFACSPTTLTTAGTQIITVAYNGKTTTYNVTVSLVPVNSIKLSATSASVAMGGAKQLTATILPLNAANRAVIWTSSNISVAAVSSSGLVTAKTIGKATVTCTAKDGSGKTATCFVTVIPQTPTGVKAASASYNSINVSWTLVASATRYAIYRAMSQTGTYSRIGSTDAVNFVDKSAATGKIYYYKVRAYITVNNQEILGNYSTEVSAKAVPAVPASFTAAKASTTSVKTSWKAVTGATGYEVWMATSSGGTYSKLTTTTKTTYTKTSLTKNKTYYFKVRAYKTVNGTKVYGAFTSIKSAKPS